LAQTPSLLKQYCAQLLNLLCRRHHPHGRWAGSGGSRGTRADSAAAGGLEYMWWTRVWANTPLYL